MEKKRKNLVFTSAGDVTKFDELWLDEDREYDVWVVYYGDDEDTFQKYKDKVDYIERRKDLSFKIFTTYIILKTVSI